MRRISKMLIAATAAGTAVLLGSGAALPRTEAFRSSTALPSSTALSSSTALPSPTPFAELVSPHAFAGPPTNAQCELQYGVDCYSPQQIQTAYELGPLLAKGDNGKGATIVLVDSYGAPDIAESLKTFDQGFHLQAPPSFKIITPEGKPPAYTNAQEGWAVETSLDVEYSHAMAPDADILLVETPTNETVGTAGFPQIVAAEEYVIKHNLGDVISQSFGAPEAGFPNAASIDNLRGAYVLAAKDHVTVLAASGDDGASGPSDAAGDTFFTKPVVNWPASDPLVTGVGGTDIHLNAAGDRTSPDTVWNDTATQGDPAAGGGGKSAVFTRPAFQSGVASVVGGARGVPDVALSASVSGSVLVYIDIPGGPQGYVPIAGTSEASPLFAGIVAIADQVAGKKLGDINPLLYKLASGSAGLPDITKGNNTVSFFQNGTDHTVKGFAADKGYDLASGLGTVDAAKLVPALVAASK